MRPCAKEDKKQKELEKEKRKKERDEKEAKAKTKERKQNAKLSILYQTHISILEKIQRRAARWAVSNYSYRSSVSAMLHHLNWPPLAQRRKQFRLNLFYQTIYNLTGLSLPEYYHPTSRHTRHHHPLHLITPPSNTIAYMSSFFPSTIRDWNQLPLSIIELTNYNNFSSTLTDYMYYS